MTGFLRQLAGAQDAAEECRDLYVEDILVPRILVLAVSLGLPLSLILLVVMFQSRPHRGSRVETVGDQTHALKQDEHTTNATARRCNPAGPGIRRQKCFAYGIIAISVWVAASVLTLQSGSLSPSNGTFSMAGPRMVYSFTTISEGIKQMRPTLDSVINQQGRGFDAIYVVVPRIFRKQPMEIPSWLLHDVNALNRSSFHGITFATGVSQYNERVRVVLIDDDYGPASKILGTLLVEQDPETIIVYGDDDRTAPPQLSDRALYYATKFPNDAIAVLGGWMGAEDALYCGRSLDLGTNRVSFVGGAGAVAVRRKFYGLQEATLPVFNITKMSKACFLGDDYYLSRVLSQNGVARRLVRDSCWQLDRFTTAYPHPGLSYAKSSHPGGANVEHYQDCIRELGLDQDLSGDGEFPVFVMYIVSHLWGLARGLINLSQGHGFVPC